MTDITQSATQTFISHQSLTHPNMLEGTPVAVASYLSGVITVKVANVETTANATGDRKSTRLNSSHSQQSRMPSSA